MQAVMKTQLFGYVPLRPFERVVIFHNNTNIGPLHCIPEINVMLYVNFTSIKY